MADKQKRISYFAKKPTECPVCHNEFKKEEMLTGRGRLIAGKLTAELRRLYEKNLKFGRIYPLAYPVLVCPDCYYAAYDSDFSTVPEEQAQALEQNTQNRQAHVEKLFGYLDFHQERTLITGTASYVLADLCYEHREKSAAPTFKQALSCLRAAWLFNDIGDDTDKPIFHKIRDYYYIKATEKYLLTLERMNLADKSQREPIDSITNFGPDTDKNYGYESILYLSSYLPYKTRDQITDPQERTKRLERAKTFASKIFGTGKSSKSKPSVLVDMTKDLYDEINDYLKSEAGSDDNNA